MVLSMFYLFDWFRSFLPLHNPIGFGVVDFIELGLGLALVLFALLGSRIARIAGALARRPAWCMGILFVLPIALRLLLALGVHPIPAPNVSDDFSYLLLGDTLAHFRLANPPHPLHRFFETFYVLQEPSYSSIYPLGQGLVLALGEWIFRCPWAGVAISAGALAALAYWMLRGWTTPEWSLAGGLLCVIEFGPLSHWMNSYWGGAVSACAGCLAFGALPRLRANPSLWNGALLGLGAGLEMLTRPFESVLLITALIFLAAPWRRAAWKALPAAALLMLACAGLIYLHNKRVTGDGLTLPYALSRYQYGIPAAFTIQPKVVPHRELTPQQQLAYRIQASVHGPGTDTFRSWFSRLAGRVGFYRFFFPAPIYLALPFSFVLLRSYWPLLLTILWFAAGTNFYPYFYPHYIAALACVFVLVSVASLAALSRFSPAAAYLLLFFCFAHFALWYGVHFGRNEAMWRYESWDAINYGDASGRLAIQRELSKIPGKKLVLVRYSSQHTITEWVFNAADIDSAPVVWARDLGDDANQELIRYYPDRKPFVLEADARPPALEPYEMPQRETPAPVSNPPSKLKFEDVK
jgi:hypothetical protein